jgi:hypothetical protein
MLVKRYQETFLPMQKLLTDSFYLAGDGARTEATIIAMDISISTSSISAIELLL